MSSDTIEITDVFVEKIMEAIAGFLLMVAAGLVDPIIFVSYVAGWRCRHFGMALSIGAANGFLSVVIVEHMANVAPSISVALSKVFAGIFAAAFMHGIAKIIRKRAPSSEGNPHTPEKDPVKTSLVSCINNYKNSLSGWQRLFLCLVVTWLMVVSFFAVPEFEKYRERGSGVGCHSIAKAQMLDKVEKEFPNFDRMTYVEHAEYPNGRHGGNTIFPGVTIPLDILPKIVHDYNSIDFNPILYEMYFCIDNEVSKAKSASFKRNLYTGIRYYGLFGLLPLLGIYLIGKFVAPWIMNGFKM